MHETFININEREKERDTVIYFLNIYFVDAEDNLLLLARTDILTHRKLAAELIHSWGMTDGHLEKRHLSSSLSDLFPQGENYKCIFIARRAIVVS